MAILITGGTGLIGSGVVRSLLEKGEIPVALDLREPGRSLQDLGGKFVFVKGGINDLDFLMQTMEDHGINRVVHLAALLQFGCELDPQKAIEVNVQGTLNVLEASRRIGVKKIVFASSAAVYGPGLDPIDEGSPILPGGSLYGTTKFLGEVLLDRYQKLYGVPFIALRYWGVYGPGEVRSAGMAEVFKKIESTISTKAVVIEEVGAEEPMHFTFVKDAAQATVKALFTDQNAHRIFNIAGGEESYVTFGEFYRVIKKLLPSAGEAIFRGKRIGRGKVNISLARAELNYVPEYTLERGIREDIDFILNHKT